MVVTVVNGLSHVLSNKSKYNILKLKIHGTRKYDKNLMKLILNVFSVIITCHQSILKGILHQIKMRERIKNGFDKRF
jgi:hypothetical protein